MKAQKYQEGVAIFILLLFVYTASSKVLEHDRFVFQLKLSPLSLIVYFASFLSWAVPVTEFVIATLLIRGLFNQKTLKAGLWFSLVLMSSFEIYITAMLFSGKDLPCACGGIISLMSWKAHELFNGVTIAMIIVALIIRKGSGQTD